MHRTIRLVLGSVTFLAVSILSAAESAPFIQAGDDAEADPTATDICHSRCLKGLTKECAGPDASDCLKGCAACTGSIVRAKACTPREPCAQTADSKQACVNGLCRYLCQTDKDCGVSGGICRANTCQPRSQDDINTCKEACQSCKRRVGACKDQLNRCYAGC